MPLCPHAEAREIAAIADLDRVAVLQELLGLVHHDCSAQLLFARLDHACFEVYELARAEPSGLSSLPRYLAEADDQLAARRQHRDVQAPSLLSSERTCRLQLPLHSVLVEADVDQS